MHKRDAKLLCIDDEPAVVKFVRTVAERMGLQVETTCAGDDFETMYRTFQPSIIVLDLQMPDIDGITLLRFLIAEQSSAHIILLSGLDTRILRSAKELGASAGLQILHAAQKPIDATELEAILEKALDVHQAVSAKELATAIETGELLVHYQPKAKRRKRGVWTIDGAEALVRWQHPDHGLMMPDEFVPMAEKSGLIANLSDYVLREAIEQISVWQKNGLDLTVAVNLTAQLLPDLEFPDRLEVLLDQYGVDGSMLILELTETAAMTDPEITIDVLTRLRLKSVGLSIDDFGTGYSSLKQLFNMPFNELKLDQSFVRRVADSDEARTIIKVMTYLGHELHMSVCAEGVETREILDFLDKLKCDKAQGYLLGRPMHAAQIPDHVSQWNMAA